MKTYIEIVFSRFDLDTESAIRVGNLGDSVGPLALWAVNYATLRGHSPKGLWDAINHHLPAHIETETKKHKHQCQYQSMIQFLYKTGCMNLCYWRHEVD
jgi:hypothetical protein